jgi:hypothetical protein
LPRVMRLRVLSQWFSHVSARKLAAKRVLPLKV